MASIYMRIDGVQVDGGATIEGLPGEGWFALSSYSWGAMRNVAMDIGNGTNADSGMVAMSEVNITKEVDGASEDLLSFLFSPGTAGKDVEIVFTKPARDGSGAEIYFQVKLNEARLVSYNVSGSDGSQPFESIALSYVQLDQLHWHEDNGGKMDKGGLVSYNVPGGKMLSGSK
ncbi:MULTISPECIES: Hcp family type VI secretion system effector [Photobacterium]|uniref:Hcp family type VI secretion system effector n=1 Tax=Photobacterium TaxID=657 RepID=UPI001EF4C221|nr:type VI secretion system tube protein Hcp [Photobacterium sp. OFAV2-7]MCG7586592.1 type VI secretion system tube protein Hcp [Photobacterium sp. OFAV2-7]